MDFGYPQNSETETLKQYISTEEIKSDKLAVTCGTSRLARVELIVSPS